MLLELELEMVVLAGHGTGNGALVLCKKAVLCGADSTLQSHPMEQKVMLSVAEPALQ